MQQGRILCQTRNTQLKEVESSNDVKIIPTKLNLTKPIIYLKLFWVRITLMKVLITEGLTLLPSDNGCSPSIKG